MTETLGAQAPQPETEQPRGPKPENPGSLGELFDTALEEGLDLNDPVIRDAVRVAHNDLVTEYRKALAEWHGVDLEDLHTMTGLQGADSSARLNPGSDRIIEN